MPKIMYRSGVYQIINTATGKMYVGSAARSLKKRWVEHRNALRAGAHTNTYLQRSWNKYGESCFVFEVIERCHRTDCIKKEQRHLNAKESYIRSKGYNISPTAGSPLGVKHSAEVRAARKEFMRSPEVMDKHRRAHENPEVIAKRSLARKLWWANPVNRANYAGRKGKPHSKESREKISKALLGNKLSVGRVVSEETREKIRAKAIERHLRRMWHG